MDIRELRRTLVKSDSVTLLDFEGFKAQFNYHKAGYLNKPKMLTVDGKPFEDEWQARQDLWKAIKGLGNVKFFQLRYLLFLDAKKHRFPTGELNHFKQSYWRDAHFIESVKILHRGRLMSNTLNNEVMKDSGKAIEAGETKKYSSNFKFIDEHQECTLEIKLGVPVVKVKEGDKEPGEFENKDLKTLKQIRDAAVSRKLNLSCRIPGIKEEIILINEVSHNLMEKDTPFTRNVGMARYLDSKNKNFNISEEDFKQVVYLACCVGFFTELDGDKKYVSPEGLMTIDGREKHIRNVLKHLETVGDAVEQQRLKDYLASVGHVEKIKVKTKAKAIETGLAPGAGYKDETESGFKGVRKEKGRKGRPCGPKRDKREKRAAKHTANIAATKARIKAEKETLELARKVHKPCYPKMPDMGDPVTARPFSCKVPDPVVKEKRPFKTGGKNKEYKDTFKVTFDLPHDGKQYEEVIINVPARDVVGKRGNAITNKSGKVNPSNLGKVLYTTPAYTEVVYKEVKDVVTHRTEVVRIKAFTTAEALNIVKRKFDQAENIKVEMLKHTNNSALDCYYDFVKQADGSIKKVTKSKRQWKNYNCNRLTLSVAMSIVTEKCSIPGTVTNEELERAIINGEHNGTLSAELGIEMSKFTWGKKSVIPQKLQRDTKKAKNTAKLVCVRDAETAIVHRLPSEEADKLLLDNKRFKIVAKSVWKAARDIGKAEYGKNMLKPAQMAGVAAMERRIKVNEQKAQITACEAEIKKVKESGVYGKSYFITTTKLKRKVKKAKAELKKLTYEKVSEKAGKALSLYQQKKETRQAKAA